MISIYVLTYEELQPNWFEKCVNCTCLELFWPRVVHKWLNIATDSPDYSADSDDSFYDPVDSGLITVLNFDYMFYDGEN